MQSFNTQGALTTNPIPKVKELSNRKGGFNFGNEAKAQWDAAKQYHPAKSTFSEAAGRSDLQGRDYYSNLSQQGNPAEQHAAQGWLARHPLEQYGPGNKDVKSFTTDASGKTTVGLYSDQKPTTPGVMGKTTTIKPATTTATTPQTGAPQVGNQMQNAQNVLNAGQGTDEETRIRQGLQQAGLFYGNKGAAPLGGFNIGGAAQNFQQAQQGLLNSLVTSANPQLQDLQAIRGSQLQATGNVLGAGTNQQGEYGKPSFNPLTGQYSGSGSITTKTDIQSIQDAKAKLNDIDTNSTAINTQFGALLNYAATAGLDKNVPIAAGLQQALSKGLVTSAAITGFNTTIASLNEQLTAQGEAPIDPSTATQTQIAQAQETVKKNLERKKEGYNDYISNYDQYGNPKGGSGGAPGGSWNDIFG